ncbi:MAG TPA: S41 family peptidase [bacterium]|nr:S41 family peptidase [bacterium]HPR88785.1 S41 family peptidase [bacterium]
MNKNILRFLGLSVVCLVIGIAFTHFGDNEAYPQDNIRADLDRFVEVFAYVKRYYVEPVESDKLITGAIEGLLAKLDPHSVYIPKKSLEKVNEQFEGSFEGIGIEFIVLNKILTVVSPIPGGPSEAVGVLPGDQIVRIDGTSAYGITEDEVFKKLRGPKGSKVKVVISRTSLAEPFEVEIVRDKIPINSLYSAFMMDDGKTGYIWLARFAKTTSDELETALKDLRSQGMERLIFDLRSNSGGLLEQAVEVADKFIPAGQKLVYTRGRLSGADEDFFSSDAGDQPRMPMIVMISHGSASASEIVAGAIQDLDRGLVVGQTSFGKGLVQNQIGLKDGSALRLTVARYYTPSGRLIQRPYTDGLADYYAAGYDDEDTNAPAAADSGRTVYRTRAGRVVYGGGGITPDSTLKPERITRFTNGLFGSRIFFELGSKYGTALRGKYTNFAVFRAKYSVGEEIVPDLKELLKKNKIEFSEEAYKKDQVFIKAMVKAEVARSLWDSKHYYQVLRSEDPEVIAAEGLMPQAAAILKQGGW